MQADSAQIPEPNEGDSADTAPITVAKLQRLTNE